MNDSALRMDEFNYDYKVNKTRMIKKITIVTGLLVGFWSSLSSMAVELEYYLPDAKQYNSEIPTPESVLGYQVGEWHVRPEQIDRYFHQLADQSSRVKIETIGYTHEKRPLILAYISSPENIARLEDIRQAHLARLSNKSGNKKTPSENVPVVTWMGYSVHGNEASGSNASLLLAYHLAAANDQQTLDQLKNQVIIIDPMLNPDGLARFAHWVNMYKSQIPNADPKTMEHNEVWPRGRTNHYWFDLNRDWLLLQHPESRARVSKFHQWRPHILTDFHEMGTNSSYFFQPGVHSRQNPLTPEENFKMTATIAEYHAKALDGIGSLYYTKENFDDFYYGKGSTYPDVHGSVGILFEQASARGHAQDSVYGTVGFPFAVKNHLTTSFSTLEAAQQNRDKLKSMSANFVAESAKMAKADRQRAVVFESADRYRLNELKRILNGHKILHYPLAKDLKIDGQVFHKNSATIIPLQQAQYRLIKSIFESRKTFEDKVFYDVSAWNMGAAFDLNYSFVSRSDFARSLLGKNNSDATKRQIKLTSAEDKRVLGLAFDWNNFNVVNLLGELQRLGLVVQGVTKPTQIKTTQGDRSLSLGSVVLMLNNQKLTRRQILAHLAPKLKQLDIQPIEIMSGLAISGVDMGSPSVPVLKTINPLLIVGEGVSSYDAGEVWHLLDQRISQPVTMMTQTQFKKLPHINYSHLILVSGQYQFDDDTVAKIESWVNQGGIIVAHSSGAKWLLSQGWTSSEIKQFDKPVDTTAAYQDKSQVDAEHVIGGAITHAKIDSGHPLAFGLDNQDLAIFKRGRRVFTEPREAFVSVARFTDKPHAAGYLSEANSNHIAGGTSVLIQGKGSGRLIAFSDNPLFRGFWLGTSRVFLNALYYGQAISAPGKSKEKDENNQKPGTGKAEKKQSEKKKR
ncbi:M14 family metallopeptidase [Aliikangiella coralliicola]|uniref:Peptidase M14 domain-containing protein n=1 Tax=Aliikangiella coralliicola TaxID=2592383 RepID=A0A545UJH3_9GAMM|nr:M14 family metallopeptidase [Aliikangiella coralliicola]TQV89609.1 hypothetical protein FLL46_01625 [Aliikangiella coralliicola]